MARVSSQPISVSDYPFHRSTLINYPNFYSNDPFYIFVMELLSSSLIEIYLAMTALFLMPWSIGTSNKSPNDSEGLSSEFNTETVGFTHRTKHKKADNISPGDACEDCEDYDLLPQQDPIPRLAAQMRGQCDYPCQCKSAERKVCKGGVPRIMDGCNCCYMCARQQGDLCNSRDKCDLNLQCDYQLQDNVGICRVTAAAPCHVDGQLYKDGETFERNCRQLCTCQNGEYACTTKCPQEDREPSRLHCKNPQLIRISGQCCKEWVCSLRVRPILVTEPITSHPMPVKKKPECRTESVEWSSCSVSCGMGESVRFTNENPECQSVKETRLCMMTPCGGDTQTEGRCRTSWRPEHAHKLHYNGCTSVDEYRPRFCTPCRRRRCCIPAEESTRTMEFQCADNQIVVHDFLWIRSCRCSDRCP